MKILARLRATIGGLPPAVRWTVWFYLAHVLAQGKVAPSEIGIAATLFCFAWALSRGQLRPKFHILFYPLAVYGIVSTASALVNHASMHMFGEAATWLKMMIFPVALTLFRRIPAVRVAAVGAEALFATAVAAYGIVQYAASPVRDLEHRITGGAAHVMTYSGMLLPMSLLLVILAAHRRQAWLIGAASIVTVALLLTLTRSVWLGWLVAILTVIVLKRVRLLVYAVPLFVLFVTFMPVNMFGRLISSFDTRQSSNLDRIRMAEAGLEMIKDHPLLGVGPAQVKEIYPLYRKGDAPRFRPPHLHNNLIQLWAERGVVAVGAYLILIGLFLRECARGWGGAATEFAEAGVAIAVGLAYAGLFEFNFGDTEVFLMMLELFALVVASIEAASAGAAGEPNEPAIPDVPLLPVPVRAAP